MSSLSSAASFNAKPLRERESLAGDGTAFVFLIPELVSSVRKRPLKT
jgi:hypothetical protein